MGTILAKIIVIQSRQRIIAALANAASSGEVFTLVPINPALVELSARRDLPRSRKVHEGAERAAERVDEALFDSMEDLRLYIAESQ
jgi:hypothetical protein